MKKPILIGAIAGAAVVAGAPVVIGSKLQSQIEEAVTTLNENPVYTAKVVEYNKGFLSSTALVEVGIDLNAVSSDPAAPQDLPDDVLKGVFTLDAAHGFVFSGEHSGLGLASWVSELNDEALRELLQWSEDQPLYRSQGVMTLTGDLVFEDSIAAFTIDDHDGFEPMSIVFEGYEGKGISENGVMSYSGAIKPFKFEGAGSRAKMSEIALDMTMNGDFMEAISGAIIDSSFSMTMSEMLLAEEGEDFLSATGIQVTGSNVLNEQKTTANMQLEYQLDSLTLEGYVTRDIGVDVAMNNLNTDAIRAYQNFANKVSGLTPDVLAQEMQALVQTNMLVFLKDEPEMNITRLEATFPEGKVEGRFDSKIVGVTELPAMMEDPAFWLQHLIANAEISMDKALAEVAASKYMLGQLHQNPQTAEMSEEELVQLAEQQSPMMLDMFTQQGLLKLEGERYQSSFSLKDGAAELNGAPMPLPIGG